MTVLMEHRNSCNITLLAQYFSEPSNVFHNKVDDNIYHSISKSVSQESSMQCTTKKLNKID